jgi:ketosteroid isomerase-like protein
VPIGQHCFIRMRVILLRREGRPVIQPRRAETADSSDECGDLALLFDRGSPAVLLVRAVGVCHAEEVGAALGEGSLRWSAIEVQTDAACTAVPSAPCLDTVTVYSIIYGGDPSMRSQYAAASRQARDRSLIGRTIRGNVAYKAGAVTVVADDAPSALLPCAAADTDRAGVFPDAPAALANRLLAAFNRHRHDELIATMHPDCTLEDVALGLLLQDRAVVADYYRSWWDAFGLIVTDARCRRSGAETVAVEAHCIGTRAGALRGIVPTHRKMDLRIAAMLRFRGGLMSDARIYYDSASLHHQLGIAACTP